MRNDLSAALDGPYYWTSGMNLISKVLFLLQAKDLKAEMRDDL